MRYEIKGKVIDQKTREGVAGVRVEAWGTDLDLDDDLGYAATLYDGSFAIPFDEDTYRDLFRERHPDIYLDVYCGDELLASTQESTHWRVEAPNAYVTIEIPPLKPVAWGERHVYLKIERFGYNPVKPVEEEAGGATYGRDCMRNKGHENGFIPQPEIDARALDAIVYREYLDSAYLIPKPDKLIHADINEPLYEERVPGAVIYARPNQRLKIHVWNTDDVPHSLHAHGLRYGIDSDGTWPFGTQASAGGRSDAICPGETWCYTFDVTYDMIGVWPFHDYTHYSNISIEQGLFGGIVVLSYCDKAPAPFLFDEGLLGGIYADLERSEGRSFLPEGVKINFNECPAPFILAPQIHFKRLKPISQQLLEHHLDFLEEFVSRAYSLPSAHIPTDHVPVFFHRMSRKETPPVPVPPRLLDLDLVLDRQRRLLDLAVGLAPRPFDLPVNPVVNPLVPDRKRAAIPSLCINGRSFVGNTPTIVGRSGQRIRWYVFNLDISTNGHNFHPHGMRWKFAGEYIDTRSFGPGESFVVEATIPPVVLLTEEEAQIQQPKYRPKAAKLYCIKGDFLFHCHEQDHLLNGMAGLVRSRQSFWLTPEMADEINRRTGLPMDDGRNTCPDVEPDPCGVDRIGHWEEVAGAPQVLLMHSILLPKSKQVLFWGQTRADQARIWDYSTPAGSFISPFNQTADLTANSDLWSAAHALLDTPQGTLLVHGGFTGGGAFTFDPSTRTYAQVGNTVGNRFYATTIVIGDGRAVTLFGNVKTIEVFTPGVGWAPPIDLAPFGMSHHQYYPWTYLLPDGRLFIAGPHDPSQRFDFNAPAGVESFATGKGDRTTPGEKGTSVLLILRPPDYKPIAYIMGGQFPTVEKSAQQIDLSALAPAWVDLPDLKNARNKQFTATLLPDGRVFIAGGIEGGADGGPCEIFDPRNPGAGWVEGPNIKFVRSYHSSFLLLQDGSILGGGAPPNNALPPFTPHERFFPGYFDKLRPVITGAPGTINYGGNFKIDTPTPPDISEVVLLRAGATTHGFNMGQRGIECVIAGRGPGTLDVKTPPNANLAPPGWYLLFILDSDRVPSEGQWIRLTP
ncbi:MAG TPA: galactose oxidase-like domain-containing protein [Pyrinomonadaceae bacterium]|nr:galactose oxidase-like domain-containing protein [Pyrinomonadaceae bacterium]